MTYKIKVDANLCIGCQACTFECPNFVMEGNVAKPKQAEVEEIGCNEKAKDICPVDAIKITES